MYTKIHNYVLESNLFLLHSINIYSQCMCGHVRNSNIVCLSFVLCACRYFEHKFVIRVMRLCITACPCLCLSCAPGLHLLRLVCTCALPVSLPCLCPSLACALACSLSCLCHAYACVPACCNFRLRFHQQIKMNHNKDGQYLALIHGTLYSAPCLIRYVKTNSLQRV